MSSSKSKFDALTDGGTTNPIHISGMADTVTAEDGDIVIVRKESYSPTAKQDREFIWSGGTSGKWNLFGEVNIEDFGELAWLDATDLQTASEVVTASGAVTINSTAAGGTGVITAASGTVVTDTSVDVTGTITAPTITQGTKTPTNKYAHDVAVVTDTSVDVTGTITAPTIQQGIKTPTNKYAHDVTVVTDTGVDVTGTIAGPTITQGTKTPTNVYGHNAKFATEGVVLSANATTETLTFTAATPGDATLVNSGYVASNLVFKPMICTATDYAISPDFVPYAKSNYELTQNVRPVPRLVDAGAKNLLKIAAASQTINGVTFTVNDDGTVSVDGTNNTSSVYSSRTSYFIKCINRVNTRNM